MRPTMGTNNVANYCYRKWPSIDIHLSTPLVGYISTVLMFAGVEGCTSFLFLFAVRKGCMSILLFATLEGRWPIVLRFVALESFSLENGGKAEPP